MNKHYEIELAKQELLINRKNAMQGTTQPAKAGGM